MTNQKLNESISLAKAKNMLRKIELQLRRETYRPNPDLNKITKLKMEMDGIKLALDPTTTDGNVSSLGQKKKKEAVAPSKKEELLKKKLKKLKESTINEYKVVNGKFFFSDKNDAKALIDKVKEASGQKKFLFGSQKEDESAVTRAQYYIDGQALKDVRLPGKVNNREELLAMVNSGKLNPQEREKALFMLSTKKFKESDSSSFPVEKPLLLEKLVTPKKGESKDDFISRFMSSKQAKVDFPVHKQRVAVAFSQLKRKNKKKLNESLFKIKLKEKVGGKQTLVVDAESKEEALKRAMEKFELTKENVVAIEEPTPNVPEQQMQSAPQPMMPGQPQQMPLAEKIDHAKQLLNLNEKEKITYVFKGPVNNGGYYHSNQNIYVKAYSPNQAAMLIQRQLARKYPQANIWVDQKYLSQAENSEPKLKAYTPQTPQVTTNTNNNDNYDGSYVDKDGNVKLKLLDKNGNLLETKTRLSTIAKLAGLDKKPRKKINVGQTTDLKKKDLLGKFSALMRNALSDYYAKKDEVQPAIDAYNDRRELMSDNEDDKHDLFQVGLSKFAEIMNKKYPSDSVDDEKFALDRDNEFITNNRERLQQGNAFPVEAGLKLIQMRKKIPGTSGNVISYNVKRKLDPNTNLPIPLEQQMSEPDWDPEDDYVSPEEYKKLNEKADILKRYGVKGFNKPKRTPGHKTKSHLVVAKKGDKIKVVRFGAQGVKGSPKKDGESESYKKRRQGFVARHKAQNPGGMKDKFSALYWANKVKW